MTVKYEYKSICCGSNYIEQRGVDEPMFFPICNFCGVAGYELVKETVMSQIIERSAPEIPTEDPSHP